VVGSSSIISGRGSGAGSEPLAKAGMEKEQRQSRIPQASE